jgi:starch-binding outer membrane protein SusE/F
MTTNNMKTMKTILWNITLFASLIFIFTGCEDEDKLTSTKVTSVDKLYEPADSKSVILQSSNSAALYFEWEHAKAEDGGMVLYEVAFDVEGGDFSDPVYKMASDNNGGYNYATISHKQLNKIAGMAGIGSSETGKVSWTVFSSKGINEVKAEETRTLEITRLPGFADVPVDVYVTGDASEGGAELANAGVMKSTASGEFEIYTKLTAGKTYFFTDANAGSPRQFYIENGLLKEGSETITPEKTAVYRINLDFTLGTAVCTEITDVQVYFSPTDEFLFSHEYIGGGVWKASSQPITFKQESWGRDQRYKFMMSTINSAGEEVSEWWGTLNSTDGPPSGADSYYYITQVPESRWEDKFKFADEMDGALVDITFDLSADGQYTHFVEKVGEQ